MVSAISGGRKISAECRQGFCHANLDQHHYIFLIQQVISTYATGSGRCDGEMVISRNRGRLLA
jgi:hypothetical protein